MDLKLHARQSAAFLSTATEILYGGAAGGGKALALDTAIPTPTGWTTMGEVNVGDFVLDEQGNPCRVQAATEVMLGRPCYRLTFCDGSQIVADANHQWWTFNNAEREALRRRTDEFRANRRALRASRGTGARQDVAALNASRAFSPLPTPQGSVVSTSDIAQSIMCGKRTNHSVQVAAPLNLPEVVLPLDPYVFGVWLGDGTRRQGEITTIDSQILDQIRARGFEVRERPSKKYGYGVLGLQKILREMGVTLSKKIPSEYLRASENQRMELLRGLMDTDGTCNLVGQCEFDNCDLALITSVHELLSSLGIKVAISEGRAKLHGKDCGSKYRIKFSTTKPVFHLERKKSRQITKERGTQKWRMIKEVIQVGSMPVRCIQVDSPRNLFLAGTGMIPTHNSHLLRVASIVWSLEIEGLQTFLFRRLSDDLVRNHFNGPTGYPALLKELIDSGHAKVNYSKNYVEFYTGSRISLMHCQYEKDKYKMQGAEAHLLLIDELTHFTPSIYAYLRGRCRLGGLKLPEKYQGQFPKIISGSNPGGIGHNWVKAAFVDMAPPMTIVQQDAKEGGMRRQYINALLSDNPTLVENDPAYLQRLEGLGDPALVRAMATGDWNIVSGGMFDSDWSEKHHVLEPFNIPASWHINRGFDWGSSKPSAVLWFAESDGTEAVMADGTRRAFPRGSVFVISEFYTWNGKPNEGNRMTGTEIARNIRLRDNEMCRIVHPGPADSAIWTVENGNCIADDMAKAPHFIRWTKADKSPGSRKNGWDALRKMLQQAKGNELPGLYFFSTCRHSIRTIPVLPRDETKDGDIDTDAEDHCGDTVRYRVSVKRKTMSVTGLPI